MQVPEHLEVTPRRSPRYSRRYTSSSVSMRRESVQGEPRAAGRATHADKVDDMSGTAERRVSDSLTHIA